jgi:hypothetical protein
VIIVSSNLLKVAAFEANASDTEFTVADTDLIEGIGADGVSTTPALNEDAVTGANGCPLPDDGGAPFAACRAYLRAIHNGDWRALQGLAGGEAAALFDETSDFHILQGLRPASPFPAGGYYTETEATVTVQGVTRGGFLATWTYQLSLLENSWRVERERWD